MKVFRIANDNKYRGITTEEHAKLRPYVDRMSSPIGEFTFPDFYILDPKLLIGNFYSMGYKMLAYDDIARDALTQEVSYAGENYRFPIEDVGMVHALNVMEACDALNHDKSVWREEASGKKLVVLEHVFHPSCIVSKSGLFVLKENRYSKIFSVTGMPNQKGDFYARYREAV